MYTQCPDCATVFRVTAEALRAAQGDVRCGVCSTSFNALENLSEQAFKSVPEPAEGSPDDSMTVEELPGSENIE
ncbi:MAG TPA: MJ0042-type zinc finger domain-containing protein, partial [Steroidobacteraceae bacterium]